MSNLVNRLAVAELTEEFKDAQGAVLVSFGGLTVAESEKLRDELAAKGVRFRMVRNSLARRAFAERGLEFGGAISGNTAIAYGTAEAAVHAARILTSPEVKKAKKVELRGSMLEGRVLGPADTAALAEMPDQPTLRAKLLGCISGPARGIAGALQGLPSALTRVLSARSDQLGGASPEA